MNTRQDNPESLLWREIRRELLLAGTIFSVNRVRRRSAVGTEGDFVLLDAPDWVTVIPLLDDGENEDRFLMVEQFRHGSGRVTIEFPAGTVEPGEDPMEAGSRELLEETGYRADRLVPIGDISPNPAFMNNRVYFFLATGLEHEREQQLDEHEQIHFHTQPARMVEKLMGHDEYDNGVMLMALYYYEMWKRRS